MGKKIVMRLPEKNNEGERRKGENRE